MKPSFSCLTAVCLIAASSANAADLPTKAPPLPPAFSSWSGFYIGAALGAKWTDTKWTTTSAVDAGAVITLDASSPRTFDAAGVRVGGYVGYNWQFASRGVIGFEADLGSGNKRDTTAGIPGCSIQCLGSPGPNADLSSVRIGWDASVRGRLGYLVSPNLLLYGTGGIAWQRLETSATCQFSVPDPLCQTFSGFPFATTATSTTRTGWTLGGGVDYKVTANWIARAEYRYSDFGTWNVQSILTAPGTPITNLGYQVRAHPQLLTAGIAYRFGS